jgi:biotin carboxyl carrier protein
MTEIRAETDSVINYLVFKDGDRVNEGNEIMQTEIMKMMFAIVTTVGGTIKYRVKQGDFVYAGTILAEVV